EPVSLHSKVSDISVKNVKPLGKVALESVESPRSWSLGERFTRALHAHDVVPTIDVQDLSRDAGGEWTAEKGGGGGDFFRFDAALERRAVGGVLDHLVDVADGPGSARSVRPCRDQVDADLLRAEVAGELLGVDLQGRLGGRHAAAVVRHDALAPNVRQA